MNNRYSRRALRLASLAVVLSLALLVGLSYAWFSAVNRDVSTSTVSGRTGNAELHLELSQSESFAAQSTEIGIVQLNGTDALQLLPVSTDDLAHFVYAPYTNGRMAETFAPVQGEQYYFHGRVYLRVTAEGMDSTTKAHLYLDGSAGQDPLVGAIDGELLNAARLGLRLGSESGPILRLSESSNRSGSERNTVIDGVLQDEGIVLHSDESGSIRPVTDPSRPWTEYTVSDTAAPQSALFTIDLNTVYPLDIYFYLEGCDSDCTEILSADMAQIGLRLYAVLA